VINDCKLRVTVKHEKLFENNLLKRGWVQAGTGLFTKTFGSDTRAEIHRKILPFTGQTYFSVYITDPETLTKRIIYESVMNWKISKEIGIITNFQSSPPAISKCPGIFWRYSPAALPC
jgi:hypothetical protein